MNLNELADDIHKTAIEKGWWDRDNSFPQQLVNIHGEVSEAWEEWRGGKTETEIYYVGHGRGDRPAPYSQQAIDGGWVAENEEHNPLKPEGVPIELADVIIRVLDTCAKYKIDIEAAVRLKMAYNEIRPYRHGGKRA